MSLPYENATSGEKSLKDLQKMLQEFGVNKFGQWMDFETGTLSVQFEYRGRVVEVRASASGYAAAWKQHHPYSNRSRISEAEWEKKASNIASFAVYSILRDWLKGQVTAVEVGMLSFDSAFMPHMLLPNGKRVIEVVQEQKLLPQLEDANG